MCRAVGDAVLLAGRRLRARQLPLRTMPAGGIVTHRWLLVVLAAASGCRRGPPAGECLELPASALDLGFGAPFTLRLRAGCVDGDVAWRQMEGPRLEGLTVSADGLVAAGRAPSFVAAFGGPAPVSYTHLTLPTICSV